MDAFRRWLRRNQDLLTLAGFLIALAQAGILTTALRALLQQVDALDSTARLILLVSFFLLVTGLSLPLANRLANRLSANFERSVIASWPTDALASVPPPSPVIPEVDWDSYEESDDTANERLLQEWKWETKRKEQRAQREALHEAHRTLELHEKVLRNYLSSTWSVFNPKEQGRWNENRALLAVDPRFDDVIHLTDRAFNSLAQINPNVGSSRELHPEAMHDIGSALAILEAALEHGEWEELSDE